MIIRIAILLMLIWIPAAVASPVSALSILKRVDDNMISVTRVATTRMVIHDLRRTRTVVARSMARGVDRFFVEYEAPPREKGTKMLKLKGRLWIYSPSTDRTILISGHMLRQSLMGSDLSYEDMMEERRLSDIYHPVISGTEITDGVECWILSLEAVEKDVAYQSQKIWVDNIRYVPLRSELYGKSGRLLKVVRSWNFKKSGDYWYPERTTYRDVLKKGKGTELILDSVEFDVPLSERIFSKASLMR